jgi:hypothetical protein
LSDHVGLADHVAAVKSSLVALHKVAAVKSFAIAVGALIGGFWVFGAIWWPFTIRRASIWARSLSIVGSVLMASGAIGFFGLSVSAAGGLNWLPQSFEWPVGYASGVVTGSGGLHVVPLNAPGRIQLYDANWHFIRGWTVDVGGQAFKVQISHDGQIEVFGTRKNKFYTLQGQLVRSEPVPESVDTYNAIPDGTSCFVPTPIWLWVFAGPFASWLSMVVGVLLLSLIRGRSKIAEVLRFGEIA